MTLKQIEAFRSVLLTGTATEAARLLGVSQPAISRLIADLEHELGFDLFRRAGRGLVTTDEAKELFEEVRLAFIGMERIREAARAIGNFERTRLRVVAIPSIAATFAVDFIRDFRVQHPRTTISLEVQATDDAVEWIVSQQCDVGLAHPPQGNPALRTRILTSGRSVCLVPAGHRLAKFGTITPTMLANECFISFGSGSVYRHRIDDVFRRAQVQRELRYEARTTDAVCSMVAASLGIAIVGPFLPKFGKRDGVVVKPFKPSVPLELALLWSAGRPLSAVAQQFVQAVSAHFKPSARKRRSAS